MSERPAFPKRAIVTAGMPYGNKGLHFGHIGGVFVPADMFARFLRDRLGAENVIFISGTDSYGSPIDEGYRKLLESGAFDGTIAQYVAINHEAQVRTLRRYDISLDIFEGSGLGSSKEIHRETSEKIIERLYRNGFLKKRATAQYYDEAARTFLNGRQVIGRCPVQGCKSEKAYADECDMGHQYLPEDLIAPKSTITGETPVMREVANWYFTLPEFTGLLGEHVENIAGLETTRPVVTNTISEFLAPPIIYVKNELEREYLTLADSLPPHTFRAAEKGRASFELEFTTLDDRDSARTVLAQAGLRFRTGKALVPFRITGNIDWGVPAPSLEGEEGLTIWCWPESLWAPLSFTRAYLESARVENTRDDEGRTGGEDGTDDGGSADDTDGVRNEAGRGNATTWRDWWCSGDSDIYQFIGQDNIYFYGVAQPALWSALQTGHEPRAVAEDGELKQTTLVANYHLLFLNKKASSSSALKPPMADELLDHYTPEQLRAHFLALGLGMKSVSFQPRPFDPTAHERGGDPVLKEGTLLTNVFNRIARSCFYTAQKVNTGMMPLGDVDDIVIADAHTTISEYERLMHRFEFHAVMTLMDDYIRKTNKYWVEKSRVADALTDPDAGRDAYLSVLRNTFYQLRVATVLMHPVAPKGTQMIFDYLNLDDIASTPQASAERFFSWDHIFEGFEAFTTDDEKAQNSHVLKELPPRTDFFARHPSQF